MESALSISWIVVSALFLVFVIWFFYNKQKDKRRIFCITILIIFSSANPFYSTSLHLIIAKSIVFIFGLIVLIKLYFDLYSKIERLGLKKV